MLNNWYIPVAIIRFTPNAHWAMALRGEYFKDRNGVIFRTSTTGGFTTLAGSLNIDYLPESNLTFRLEGRYLNSKERMFLNRGAPANNNTALTFSAAVGL